MAGAARHDCDDASATLATSNAIGWNDSTTNCLADGRRFAARCTVRKCTCATTARTIRFTVVEFLHGRRANFAGLSFLRRRPIAAMGKEEDIGR